MGNQVFYTPDANFNGSEPLIYTVADGEFSDTGEISIKVNAVNDDATGMEESASVPLDRVIGFWATGHRSICPSGQARLQSR